MNILYEIVTVIFLILDIVTLYFLGDQILSFKSPFWVIHFILAILFILFEKKIKENEGYDIFILLFPVLGFLMLIFEYILRFRMKFESNLEIDEGFEKYLESKEREIIVQRSLDLNLIGAYDILSVGSAKEKKDFLIGFETKNIKFKIEVLKKALWDEDIDVIHYAATEINKIDEGFQKRIEKYKKERNKDALCKEYFEYSVCGLLEGGVLEFYQIITLKLLRNKVHLTIDDLYMILVTYRNMENYEKCEEVIKKVMKRKDVSEKIINYIKQYYYEENKNDKLKEVEKWQESV